MTEYPEDIEEAAGVVAFQIAGNLANDSMRFFIAEAILAERERCVKVVREMLVYADTTSASDEAIAQRILKGGAV